MKLNHVVSACCSSRSWSPGVFLCLVLYAGMGAAAGAAPGLTALAQIQDPELKEISGIAPSQRVPGIYWVHNDSFNPEMLYAIDESGRVRARVSVAGAPNLDWEDLASFEEDGQAFLALGDIGNNLAMDADMHIYLLPEPELTDTEVRPVRDYRFRFAEGARDAESLAVDLVHRRFLIADKGRSPAGLFSLPMQGDRREAVRIADIPYVAPKRRARVTPLSAHGKAVLTGMDLSADGRRLVLLTYRHLLVFERRGDEDWAAALQRVPQAVLLPPLGFEAACWSRDGRQVLATHEQVSPVLYSWSVP